MIDMSRIRKGVEAAALELARSERLIRALCEEYRASVRIPWLCLYCIERPPGSLVQGPFWARLRRARVRGRSMVVKEYLGRRLTRSEMYRMGVLGQASLLSDYDRRARLLRERKKRVVASLETMRKAGAPYLR